MNKTTQDLYDKLENRACFDGEMTTCERNPFDAECPCCVAWKQRVREACDDFVREFDEQQHAHRRDVQDRVAELDATVQSLRLRIYTLERERELIDEFLIGHAREGMAALSRSMRAARVYMNRTRATAR